MIKVTKVKPLAGFKLDVTFNDGSHGVADLSKDLTGPLEGARAPEVWAGVRAEHGAVVWSDELDLSPEFVHVRVHEPKT